MLRFSLLLLPSLLLLTTACSTAPEPEPPVLPTPEPTHEGIWNIQKAYFRAYNGDKTIAYEAPVPAYVIAGERITLTSNALTIEKGLFGAPLKSFTGIEATSHTVSYTRQGQTLTIAAPLNSTHSFKPLTIVKLTSDTLEIQEQQIGTTPEGGTFISGKGGLYTLNRVPQKL